MADVDVQGTSKVTMICRAGSRVHGQKYTQVDVFRRSKFYEA